MNMVSSIDCLLPVAQAGHRAALRSAPTLSVKRQFARVNLLDASGAGFERRDLRSRIERRIRQLICRKFLSPVVRDEDGIWPDGPDDKGWEDSLASARNDFDVLAVD